MLLDLVKRLTGGLLLSALTMTTLACGGGGAEDVPEEPAKTAKADQQARKQATQPTQPKPAKREKPAEPPRWRESLKGVELPDVPVTGQLGGKPFAPDKITYDANMTTLELTTEGGSREGRVLLFLFGSDDIKHQAPADLELEVAAKGFGGNKPHIHWNPAGGKTEIAMKGYNLKLAFDAHEKTSPTISGRIYLCLGDDARSWVAGRFEAELKEMLLYRADGTPDLSRDSFFVIKQVLRAHLEGQGNVTDVEFGNSSYSSSGGSATGHGSATFKLDGKEQSRRFELRRTAAGKDWEVVSSFEMWQLPQAHPSSPPAQSDTKRYMTYHVALMVEKELAGAKQPLNNPYMTTRVYERAAKPYATTHVNYAIGKDWNTQKQFRRKWLWRKQDGKWAVDRELKEEEYVERKSGEVKVRKKK